MKSKSNIPIIILAAGSSTRMGSPKQLLMGSRSKSLLQHTIDICLESTAHKVYLVLGANHAQILRSINSKQCIVIHNAHWENGLGSSIATGISNIPSLSPGVVVTVADQPFLNIEVINNLIHRSITSTASIVLSKYDDGNGPPTYFSASHFEKLKKLNDDSGAKGIVRENKEDTEYIHFPKGNQDIDTIEDAKKFLF